MKHFPFLLPLVGLWLLTTARSPARLGSYHTGAEVIEQSDVIVAVQTSGFEIVRTGDDEWTILIPKDLKTYKGAVPNSELRIKAFASGEFRPGYTTFPTGTQWLLFFLKDLGGGRYQYAFDPFFQGEVDLPTDVDPLQCVQIDDLLVSLAESASRTQIRHEGIFLLLVGLPSEKARRCLSALSESHDPDVATRAVIARIRGRDPEAFDAADRLLEMENLPANHRRRLEIFLENYGKPKKAAHKPNL